MALVITDALRWWVRAQPERVALDVEGEEVTYGDLGQWTDRVAHHLATEHGVVPGDVVAVAGVNSTEWCIAALGAIKAGAILTPINYRYTVSEVDHLVQDCSPKVVIADEQEAPKMEAGRRPRPVARARADEGRARPAARRPDLVPRRGRAVGPGRARLHQRHDRGCPRDSSTPTRPSSTRSSSCSSRTRSPPEETSLLLALPLFSVAGIMHTLDPHDTSRGGKAVIMRDFDPARALELLGEHRITPHERRARDLRAHRRPPGLRPAGPVAPQGRDGRRRPGLRRAAQRLQRPRAWPCGTCTA